jgi:hypothetical protein
MFYILSPDKETAARLAYQQLVTVDPISGDRFFEAFGVGNNLNKVDMPYERFHDYELLLTHGKFRFYSLLRAFSLPARRSRPASNLENRGFSTHPRKNEALECS